MKKIIIAFLNIILCLIAITTSAFAWYTGFFALNQTDNFELSSNSGYFESGNGTKASPYIISQARHLYNLAWLQDLGYFDGDSDSETAGNQPYYFELTQDIDMEQLKIGTTQSPIPPIGIDSHPFIANFDGGGHTIQNLIIETNFSNEDYIKPSSDVLSAHTETITDNVINTTAVGTFGVVETKNPSTTGTTGSTGTTGETGTTETTTSLSVSNFILNKAKINNTKESAAVGIVCGKAKGNIKQIGVGYSAISSTATLASKYSLVGAVDDDIKDELSGAGGDLEFDSAGTSSADLASDGVVNEINVNAKYCGKFKRTKYSDPAFIYIKEKNETYTKSDFENLTSADYTKYLNIYNRYDTSKFVARFDSSSGIPQETVNGVTYKYPPGGIWFRGVSNDSATIYATGNDNNGTEVFSIYKVNKTTSTDGKTITYTIDTNNETVFAITNNNGTKDGRMGVFFNFTVEKGSYYFIGSTSSSKTPNGASDRPKFAYFLLPVGTEGFNGGISNIEFVNVSTNLIVPGSTENYVSFKVYATLAGSGEIWFVRKNKTVEGKTEDKLYYYNSNLTVSDSTATSTTTKSEVSTTDGWGPP